MWEGFITWTEPAKIVQLGVEGGAAGTGARDKSVHQIFPDEMAAAGSELLGTVILGSAREGRIKVVEDLSVRGAVLRIKVVWELASYEVLFEVVWDAF